jgi:alanine dehydrogenase
MLEAGFCSIALLADAATDVILPSVVQPALMGASIIAPGAITLGLLHKLQDHQMSGGAFLVDMAVKAGGVFLCIQVVRVVVGG